MLSQLWKFYYRESLKIIPTNPERLKWTILIVMIALTLTSIKKLKGISSNVKFLDRVQTNQSKGIAILAVIIGHFAWSAINDKNQLSIFTHWGYISVGIFLTLSAYGLYKSYEKRGLEKFWIKRVGKVLIPYAIITVIWLIMDWKLLRINHGIVSSLMMVLGINLNPGWRKSVDFNMWYITYLLVWYLIFYIVYKFKLSKVYSQIIFYFLAFVIMFLTARNITIINWGISALNFPVGITIAIYYERIISYFQKVKYKIYILIASQCVFILLYFISKLIKININDITLQYLFNSLSAVFLAISVFLLFFMLSYWKIFSKFLEFTGIISFELYLLHGPLMYRYDFILWRGPIEITFLIYLIVLYALSIVYKKATEKISIQKFLDINRKSISA